jgi:hypothetical protein
MKMNKKKIILTIFRIFLYIIVFLIIIYFIRLYDNCDTVKGRLDSGSKSCLSDIDSGLRDYYSKYHKLPDNLWELYENKFIEKFSLYDLSKPDINIFNQISDFTLAPILYDFNLRLSKKHTENTILAAQPVSVHGFRWVLLWHDFKSKHHFGHYEFVKKISEKEFQEQIKKQKWAMIKTKKESGKSFIVQSKGAAEINRVLSQVNNPN